MSISFLSMNKDSNFRAENNLILAVNTETDRAAFITYEQRLDDKTPVSIRVEHNDIIHTARTVTEAKLLTSELLA